MIAICITAPLAFALCVRLVPQRAARRAVRLILAFVAALLPFAAAGSLDGLSLVFVTLVSLLGYVQFWHYASTLTNSPFTTRYQVFGSIPFSPM